uniref:Uncharacterized protein n=1 Tax=Odontella aurita TaxID=265563 RepID=A0A7S4HMA1_9STRA
MVDGFEECRDACEFGTCCWETPAELDGYPSCSSADPDDACAGYEPCDILRATPASHPEAISSRAKKACNTQALGTEAGVLECEDFCAPIMCCFVDLKGAGSDECRNEKKLDGWCGQYGPCQALVHIPKTNAGAGLDDATAKATIEEACSAGFSECLNICSGAECCFVSGQETCSSHGIGEIVCSHYDPCTTLHVTEVLADEDDGLMTVKVPVAPTDLNLICSSPRDDEVAKCYNSCKMAHCCSEDIEVCKVMDPEACQGYTEPCMNAWEGMADEVVVPVASTDLLERVCFVSPGGAQLSPDCRDQCEVAKCCFLPDDECRVYNEEVCEAYSQYCVPAWDPINAVPLGPPPEWLGNHCADSNDSKECRDGCLDSVCCGGHESCANWVVSKALCDEYREAGCERSWEWLVVHWGEPGEEGIERISIPDSDPDDLSDLCTSTDPAARKQCDDKCLAAKCCDSHVPECAASNPEACDAYYYPCVTKNSWRGIVQGLVPPIPAYFDEYCGNGVIEQTLSQKNQCQEWCGAANCCYVGVATSCDSDHPELCSAYRNYCQPQWDGINLIEIPFPPTNLAQVCSPLSLSTGMGRMACRDACLPAMCCADAEGGCGEEYSNREMCSQYAPCTMIYVDVQEGGDLTVVIPAPPDNLGDICSAESLATAGGHDHCNATCDEARCCNLSIEQCQVHNPHICEKYEPCQVLYARDENKYAGFVEIPPPPADIGSVCSEDSLLTVQGFTHCEDVCDRARCCEETTEECHVKNPAVCDGYGACSSLVANGGAFDDTDQKTLMKLAEDVNRTCSPSNLFHPQGLSACQHVCNDRLCCFERDDSSEFSCTDRKECVIFAACENLLDYGYIDGGRSSNPENGGTATDSQVDKICESDALATMAGINACFKACSSYLCCFADNEDENCYTNQQETCDKYAACDSLVKTNAEGYARESAVTATCSSANLGTAEGLASCHKICGPHMCCFVQLGQQSNCVSSHGSECMTYGACSVLTDLGGEVVTLGYGDRPPLEEALEAVETSEVETFCSPDSFVANEDNKLSCIDACSRRACCFAEGRGSCYQTDAEWCDEFQACKIVNDYVPVDEQDDLSARDDIKGICKPEALQSSVGLSSCHDVCDPRSCCWKRTDSCGKVSSFFLFLFRRVAWS